MISKTLFTKYLIRLRKSSLLFKIFLSFTVLIILFFLSLRISDPDSSGPLRNNLGVFFLVYFNIILITVLAIITGRNVLKLIFDRKNKILGSRLQTKLVVAFAGLAIVTNIILYIFAGGLLNNVINKFFSVQIEDSINVGVDVAKILYGQFKEQLQESSDRIGKYIKQNAKKILDEERLSDPIEIQKIEIDLEKLREVEEVFSISIYDYNLKKLLQVSHAISKVDSFKEPDVDNKAIKRAKKGKREILFEQESSQKYIRYYERIQVLNKFYIIVVTLRIDPEVAEVLERVNDTYREYQQTKTFTDPLRSGYLLTLSLITVVILFGAVWFGFYIAKQLTTPLKSLALATTRVAKGDYDANIEEVGDDEFGYLATSFNLMTKELRTTRDEVTRRGQFIETILSRLGVAVIALNLERQIIQMNESSERLFNNAQKLDLPADLSSILPSETLNIITPLLNALQEEALAGAKAMLREAEITYNLGSEERKLVCTVGSLNADSGQRIGSLILFDDITEITKTQSMTVWREVARRVAHEIKNPLTPIKLSSQRLAKIVKSNLDVQAIIDCTNTIVENVDSIARLASEFSSFARMPTVELKPCDLNKICQDLIVSYKSNWPEFNFYSNLDPTIPYLLLDPEQIKRAIINLLDNAIEAFSALGDTFFSPTISISTRHDPINHKVILELADNGPGIDSNFKSRVFDPYFTTKKDGTGIGLGIVLSIISDHHGTIRILDTYPENARQKGAKFVITLPTEVSTQRKLI